jgi:alpha-tubulin suppressor-like RCC1 family protein
VFSSGGVDCWGYGVDGELGNGTFSSSPDGSATPVEVVDVGGTGTLSGVSTLIGEGRDSCALLTSGGVDCWGDDADGQLGDGTFASNPDGSASPVQVQGVGGTGTLSGVASLTGDGDDTCALLTSGGVDCWGEDHDGELGDGTTSAGSATPVQVQGVGGVGALSDGASLTSGFGTPCALLTSGGVDCWGLGPYGQLGNGTYDESTTPVEVSSSS